MKTEIVAPVIGLGCMLFLIFTILGYYQPELARVKTELQQARAAAVRAEVSARRQREEAQWFQGFAATGCERCVCRATAPGGIGP